MSFYNLVLDNGETVVFEVVDSLSTINEELTKLNNRLVIGFNLDNTPIYSTVISYTPSLL